MGLMSKVFIISGIIMLLVGIAAGILFYKVKDISSISLEDSRIQVIDVTQDSFTINGHLLVNNPSSTSVPYKAINYSITLDATGEIMASGEIPASEIAKQNTTKIEFEQVVTIPPSTAHLMSRPNIFATIRAEITLDYPIIDKFTMPFEQKIDIKPQIQQMAMAGMVDLPLP